MEYLTATSTLSSEREGLFFCDTPVSFKLREKIFSISEDSFKIQRLDTKDDVFAVKGNVFSLRDSKKLFDKDGNPLLKMTDALISIRDRMFIENACSKEVIYTLRKKGVIPIIGTHTVKVWAGDSDDGEPILEVKGDIIAKNFDIKDVATGNIIATVKRNIFNLRNVVMDKDTYVVTVNPGANTALMIFLAIAIDEQYHD